MREIDGLPVYEITIDKDYSENGEDLSIDMIAFTSNPAIQVKGMAFNSHERKLFFKDSKKMRIAAPSMRPMDIYRKDEDGTEYYVSFSAEVIEELHAKMMQNLKTKDLFNIEHEAENKVPAYVYEILLVDSEAKQKYIKDEYDVETEIGSQFIVSQITDKDYYNALVENEQFAYSIEGFLGLKLNKHNRMTNPKFELDGKFYELVDGVPVEVKASEEVVAEEEVAPVEEVALEEEKEEEVKAESDEEKEEEMAEEVVEEEKEEEVKAEVDVEVDADAVMAIVAPALDALRSEILEALAEKQVEEEVEEEEVEMQETKLSITEKFGAVAKMFRDVNY